MVCEALEKEKLGRLTLDIDGSVVTAGASVSWAFRGFNPHHRKDPSYYPILAHLAQTGHILRVKNRPGNVHDSKGAVTFVRDLIDDVRCGWKSSAVRIPHGRGVFPARDYRAVGEKRSGLRHQSAVSLKWLGLLPVIRERQRWQALREGMGCFDLSLPHCRLGKNPPRGGLPKARASRNEKELPARSV